MTVITADIPQEWLDQIGACVTRVEGYGDPNKRPNSVVDSMIARAVYDAAPKPIKVEVELTPAQAVVIQDEYIDSSSELPEDQIMRQIAQKLHEKPEKPVIKPGDTFWANGILWTVEPRLGELMATSGSGEVWWLCKGGTNQDGLNPNGYRLFLIQEASKTYTMPWEA